MQRLFADKRKGNGSFESNTTQPRKQLGEQNRFPFHYFGHNLFEEIDHAIIPPHFMELDPRVPLQPFRAQVYISRGSNVIKCKLFLRTLKGVAMQWFSSFQAKTIYTFQDLETRLVSQFTVSKAKRLEQTRGETLKQYLAGFNNAMVSKHIEVEEDSVDQLEAKHEGQRDSSKSNPQAHVGRPVRLREKNYRPRGESILYTLLKSKSTQLLREVYH
ncbi:hypothetical protein CR513_03853, partial [Mucuna pruriens]